MAFHLVFKIVQCFNFYFFYRVLSNFSLQFLPRIFNYGQGILVVNSLFVKIYAMQKRKSRENVGLVFTSQTPLRARENHVLIIF